MSPVVLAVIVGIVAIALGILIGYILRKNVAEKTIGSAEQKARNLILDAENRSETIKKEVTLEAKEEAHKMRSDVEKEVRERRAEIQRAERRVVQKEENVDRKLEGIEKKEERITQHEKDIARKREEISKVFDRKIAELEKISGYTAEEAKALLLEGIEKDCRHEASQMIKDIETKAKEEADRNAKEIICGAIQRCAADHVAETTLSVVNLPNDDMKGRIIGREGRNIRAIETLTGVDLIIDDTPEAVIVSGFDPVRREVARLALEKLIVDGRIHPAKIEEMVEKARKEVNQTIKAEGEQATFEVGIHNLHPELVKLLGRLHFRTSYGQNVLKHSIEVSHLAGLMAGELGLDVKLAKRAGLLHDIGKALDHEYEGTHVDIGIQILRKYKESEAVINGMAAHHGDYEPKSMEAVLIAAADALSAARPGARRETLDVYIKRLEKLEEIANTTPGVDKSYAIQAGREIRIIAKPEEVKDDEIALLARDISKRIESELEYPGQIKVNVVRETRAIEYAK
ncbi:ribonuclease Y [Hornefia butyriciproducens]|jgi:ribonuclease Y|uniref:Ribonuclease Y n=1 Tax=Hornefia butyriciproducens TaxID=2652293 RepID=A0A6L5Y6M8_9FIRM|nr:ribonuclease Y [Hornefia butyriciproducens]MCI7326270.1 ribonuclease Y [Clostridiales bacterium]MCI7413001.1 ribonuclease Y [Clostridiales bacterium]MDD6298485.1 ribonuclease Y [Hornefia butyriciproducens]MDD7019502.1 ribonuclease Y [Hornefia butyriciproducens]MDY2991838.1 ribonuclease Y [Hornefia butyriciproducens]